MIQRRIGSKGFVSLALTTGVGALALILATGCTSQPESETLDLPVRNLSQWAMPLDSYVDQNRFFDYAQTLLIRPCMEEASFSWPVPFRDLTSTAGPSWNAAGQKLFTPSLARTYGYHIAEPDDPTAAIWADFGTFANGIGDREQARFDTCLKRAWKTLKPLPLEDQRGLAFAGNAYEAALSTKKVTARAAQWRKCMLPAGVVGLPRSPIGMPTAESGFGGEMGDSHPSEEETRVATADADCQVSTGYQQALYAAEWSKQAALLAENLDALNREKARIDALEKRTRKVISENAPAR